MQIVEGYVTTKEEFLYPDSPLGPLPDKVKLVMANNAKPGIQLLLRTDADTVQFSLDSSDFEVEYYLMRPIPVEYNTGDGENQGGAMVLAQGTEKPDYATRQAPFEVYDCLKYLPDGRMPVSDGLVAAYVCLNYKDNVTQKTHLMPQLRLTTNGESYTVNLDVTIYPVQIPENTFWVTTWHSDEAICRFHNLKKGSAAYLDMLGLYAKAMRRMHQNIFFIQLSATCVRSKSPYQFDFEYLTPEISCFFEAGMEKMELGVLLERGWTEDGLPDMYTNQFKVAFTDGLPVTSAEGYETLVSFVQSLASYLKKHGWQDRVLFHIHDEPDIHVKNKEDLEARKGQYCLVASVLRKYLPNVEIIEAVDTAEFRGAIDIWVPGNAGYEKQKDDFQRLAALGETVWGYVCCGPAGHWLNRFLDFSLIKGRLLFWGCAKYQQAGFLHWGFNQFPNQMDPYQGTSCPNHTGIGTNFPCGDSFLIYPDLSGPNLGMRLEAQRRGIEDVALLQLLRAKDEIKCENLIGEIVTNYFTYKDNPDLLEKLYEKMLMYLIEDEV